MSNIGKKIKSSYCNGYFGRRYDLYEAKVIDESNHSLTIKIEDTEETVTAVFNSEEEKEIINDWL